MLPAWNIGRRLWPFAVVTVAIVAAILRIPILASNLFIDEVWTLNLLTNPRNAVEIVFLRHDNNHLLNSLYLYFVRSTDSWLVYRLPSFLAGAATVALLAIAGKRYGRSVGLTAAGACACSCLLVDLTTQARGYSLAMFFAVGAFLLLRRYLDAGRQWAKRAFQIGVVLGFLAHLTFLLPYAGFLAWSAAGLHRRQAWVTQFARLHVPVWSFLSVLFFSSLAGMQFGGGGYGPPLSVLAELFHWMVGIPPGWSLLTFPILAVLAWECRRIYKDGRAEWAFYAGLLVTAAVMSCATSRLSLRYFAVCTPFVLLLLSRAVVRLPVPASLSVALVFLAAQSVGLETFYRYGRGRFDHAVGYLSQFGGTVGGDTRVPEGDFRVRMMLWYYGPAVPFVEGAHWTPEAPQWVIVHSLDKDPRTPPAVYVGSNAVEYDLHRIYRAGGANPLHWFLYGKRRTGPEAESGAGSAAP